MTAEPRTAAATESDAVYLRRFGCVPYAEAFDAMRRFTAERGPQTVDEIWLLQHPPVYTQGQAGKPEHLLDPGSIPVVPIDRGGQVTYHGPGQVVAYLLLDLNRRKLGVRQLVTDIENTIVELLAHYGIPAEARKDAPGVYVDGAKIAALGLRVRRGCSYHGVALNVDMEMVPWRGINACGLGVPVTQLAEQLADPPSVAQVARELGQRLRQRFGYNALPANAPPPFDVDFAAE